MAQIKGEEVPNLLIKLRDVVAKSRGTKDQKTQIEMFGFDYYNFETKFIKHVMDVLQYLWSRDGNPKHVLLLAHVITVESAPDIKTKLVTKTRSIVTAGRAVGPYVMAQYNEVWHFCRRSEFGEDSSRRICLTPRS